MPTVPMSHKLKHRGTIQTPGTTKDALGEPVVGWTDLSSAWAAIEPLSGREYWQSKQTQSDVTHKLTFRWRPDLTLTAAMRFLHNGRAFAFREPPRDLGETHEWWEVMAVEVPTQ